MVPPLFLYILYRYSCFLINLEECIGADGEGGVPIRRKGGGGRRDTWEQEVRPGWHVEKEVERFANTA
jgi:hypothetical protein